ncbi:hypothetical protein [Massilia litorea]|uniref:Uncharacterized protein n=1 Tax=Massilia litorea TaxID=2769491 RepID=A0A7L9U446_9BURK|nr:hypothetical protein [Massilia litorea]QOL49727.1 hypothetical protein LPB04_23120 [Massilia litorea]
MTTFSDKFVAFVDILGFKDLEAKCERGVGMSLPDLLSCLRKLGNGTERGIFEKYGPTCCPTAPRLQKNLDFRVTQISDCVIVSSEVSPAGVINLISHCWGAVIELMGHGIMCRGYIKRGSVYHTDTQVVGSGYHDAYAAESRVTAFKHEADERGTPYVEVDAEVANYIDSQPDECVKEMFGRMVKRDGHIVVLFPFQRLRHSFIVLGMGKTFDPNEELKANNNLRKNLRDMKERVLSLIDQNNKNAVSKGNHYIRAIDTQLQLCDRTDERIHKIFAAFEHKLE